MPDDAIDNNWFESISLLSYFTRSKSIFWISFWIAVLATAFGIGVWQISMIVKNYLEYNTDTIIVFQDAYKTPFPAVTICNLNPMKKSVGYNIQELKELMTVYRYLLSLKKINTTLTYNELGQLVYANYAHFINPANNDSKSANGSDEGMSTTVSNNILFSTVLSNFTYPQSDASKSNNIPLSELAPDPIIFDGYTQKELDQLIEKFQLSTTVSKVTLESQTQDRLLSIINENINESYSLRDLIISCTYNMVPCDFEKDFERYVDPNFGNCYTFNNNAKHKILKVGSDFGLKMIAFSNVSEYLETSSKSGIRVVVHKQNFPPFPNTEGVNAAVGTYTKIDVEYNNIQRLGKPYGNCHSENDTLNFIYDGFYTYEGCFRTCYQYRIIDACQCADPRFPKPIFSNISWCGFTNATLFTCYQTYLKTFGDHSNASYCNCHTGCSEPEYKFDISAANWHRNIASIKTPKCWGNFPNSNIDCQTAYKENAVFLDINFNRMVHKKTFEKASMSAMKLFHQIAGTVGLWTGVSMLFIGELIELIWFCIFRPNFSSKVESTDTEMSYTEENDIYDSNMASEYENDIPQPFENNNPAIENVSGMPLDNYLPEEFDTSEYTKYK